MAKNRELTQETSNEIAPTSLNDIPSELIVHIDSFLGTQDKINFAITNKAFYTFFQQNLEQLELTELLQAVLDENEVKVKLMLDKNPALLMRTPKQNLIIESQLTWQRVYAEKAFELAIYRRQLTMIHVMLPYFILLEKMGLCENGAREALAQWQNCQMNVKDKVQQKKQYTTKIEKLIHLIVKQNVVHTNGTRIIDTISDELAGALESFRKELSPKEGVRLQESIDLEMLLEAAYHVQIDNLSLLQNSDHRSLYCIGIIGFIQSLLIPSMAKSFCHGLDRVVDLPNQLSELADSFSLADGTYYYRTSSEAKSGLGFDFFVCIYSDKPQYDVLKATIAPYKFNKYCDQITHEMNEIKQMLQAGKLVQKTERSHCVII